MQRGRTNMVNNTNYDWWAASQDEYVEWMKPAHHDYEGPTLVQYPDGRSKIR